MLCRVGAQNVALPPVPGLEPVALPQSSQSSSVEASLPANENRSAVDILNNNIDWSEPRLLRCPCCFVLSLAVKKNCWR